MLHTPDAALRGRVIPIGDQLCIGRVEQEGVVDMAIDDRLLSRQHATIKQTGLDESGAPQLLELVDHGSRNGSFVNGVRVKSRAMGDGTIIRLGVTVFELTLDDKTHECVDVSDDNDSSGALMGRSGLFLSTLAELGALATGQQPVLITGETGTGKELAAQHMHKLSAREGLFVAVSCSAVPSNLAASYLFGHKKGAIEGATSDSPGYFATAAKGTLFLDEIELLDPEFQPELLQVLQSGESRAVGATEPSSADVRILSATNANLEALVDEGAFNKELYTALRAGIIEMPSLRARRTDIPLLAEYFLRSIAPDRSFDWSATFLEKLLLYDWPMNVRELRTVMQRLTLLDDEISTLRSAHLPREIRMRVRQPTEDQLRASAISVHSVPSREELATLLAKCGGSVAELAKHYGKDRKHVFRWLSRHDLVAADYQQ